MSHRRAIDGDEPLFHFDSFESSSPPPLNAPSPPASDSSGLMAIDTPLTQSPLRFTSPHSSVTTTSERTEHIINNNNQLVQVPPVVSNKSRLLSSGKGKCVSRPVDIVQRPVSGSHLFDQLSFSSDIHSFPSVSASSPQTLSSFHSSPNTTHFSLVEEGPSSLPYTVFTPCTSYASDDELEGDDILTHPLGKGKEREVIPSLPPLSFSPTQFLRGETDWPSITQTPEELQQSNLPVNSHSTRFSVQYPTAPSPGCSTDSDIPNLPGRARSFSSLSSRSAKSLATMPMTRVKLHWSRKKSTSNLAHLLLLGKRSEGNVDGLDFLHTGTSHPPTPDEICPQVYDPYNGKPISFSEPTSPFTWSPPPHRLPLTPLDLIPRTSDHSVVPVKVQKLNLFDTLLPKEVKIEILRGLINLHIADQRRIENSINWSALRSSHRKYRWMGKDRAFIELVRLSRVSKSWQQIVFDGQLWSDIDLHAFPTISTAFLLRLFKSSGPFVCKVDFSGHPWLSPKTLLTISEKVRMSTDEQENQLAEINLTGCTTITTHSLHTLLAKSPHLKTLRVKGVEAVTNATFAILAESCPMLSVLDCSRCHRMDAEGLRLMLEYSRNRAPGYSPLKRLHASGLRRANDLFMASLGKYAPMLEVLDLSASRPMHNTSLDAFVAVTDAEGCASETVLLSSRDVGRDPGDPTKYRRRVTRLRHLSLSSCPLLSDIACSHLAHTVPRLELLELAGIGSDIRDEGLVRLLRTTPFIRKIDLEEANEITDEVLTALTPTPSIDAREQEEVQPGSRLEHITLSYAIQLTNEAVLGLIRSCPKLVSIDLDNTRVSGNIVKEFVRIHRQRQTLDAQIVAIDARGIGEGTVKEIVGSSRTRNGWRSWEARHLNYLDMRDDEELSVGQDECDRRKVVVKTFYSWQTVDAVEAAREKRRKSRRKSIRSSSTGDDDCLNSRHASRWWSPGSRRFGPTNPLLSNTHERDGCVIM